MPLRSQTMSSIFNESLGGEGELQNWQENMRFEHTRKWSPGSMKTKMPLETMVF